MPVGTIDELVSYFGKEKVEQLGLSKYDSEEYLFNWHKEIDISLDGDVFSKYWKIDVYHLVGSGFRGLKVIDSVEFEDLKDDGRNYQNF
jgi:hypothetical protein